MPNQTEVIATILCALKWAVALVAAQWCLLPNTIHVLLALMAIDWIAAVIGAGFVEKNLESRRGWRGISKKALTILLTLAVHLASSKLGLAVNLSEAIALVYAVNELISIIENCHRAGVPVPRILTNSLAKRNLKDFGTPPRHL